MLSVTRRIALLMLMLTLPFNGWALAAAQACTGMQVSSADMAKHPCCAEQKAPAPGHEPCAENKTASAKPMQAPACEDGGACQCSSAVSIAPQPLTVSADTPAPVTRLDVPVAMVDSDSAPPFRPPIHS